MRKRSLAAGAPTPDRRDRTVAQLCEHFAAGHLELDVLEQRLAAADRAQDVGELDELVSDLPVLPAPPPAPVGQRARRGWAVALLGGNSRKGEWTPPERLHAVAAMGGVELDFRDARLGPGVSHVLAIAVMGGVEITVPPGMPVTVKGLGVMGAVDQVEHAPKDMGPDTPRLEVTALACMGGVEVKTRASGGAERVARKRTE